MAQRTRTARSIGALGLLASVAACTDSGTAPPALRESPQLSAVILSDPVGQPGTAAATALGVSRAAGAPGDVAYLSLPPRAVPGGARATIRRKGASLEITAALVDGGLDPTPVPAAAGDTVELVVTNAAGAVLHRLFIGVPPSRPPVVVRTVPPKEKTDVPLNGRMEVVFSEPVDAGSLTLESVRLLRGGIAVAGSARFVDASHLSVEFLPDALLAANARYELAVTAQVRDADGEALAAPELVPFTTGESTTGAGAAVRLSPESVRNLSVGAAYMITATVVDAANNVLRTRQVSWTSSNPAVAAVRANDTLDLTRGLVTAVSDGAVTITATSGSVHGTATITTSRPPPSGIASLTIEPESLSLSAFDPGTFTVRLWDSAGRELTYITPTPPSRPYVVAWTSSDPTVVPLGRLALTDTMKSAICLWAGGWATRPCGGWSSYRVRGVGEGTTTLIATSEGASDTVVITIGPPRPVAEVRVRPAGWTLYPTSTFTASVTLWDASGGPIAPDSGGVRPVAWTSDNPAAVAVDAEGTITAAGIGRAIVTATSEGVSATLEIVVPLLTFASVSAGHPNWQRTDGPYEGHSCAVTLRGATVCWGGDRGEVGDQWRHYSMAPWAVTSGGLTFSTVSAGGSYTCGLTAAGTAYCWGDAIYLEPYEHPWVFGTTDAPMAVPGGRTFVSIDAGDKDVCGLTAAGDAYCWDGESAIGTPTLVPGGLTFVALSVGLAHSCGLTASSAAYCWGSNSRGQLGDGSTHDHSSPVPVAGGQDFVALAAGKSHSCALTATGAAYCWGSNGSGELGDGSTSDSPTPVAVRGNLRLVALSAAAAASTTCGLTASGDAYCWGENYKGQVGDGSNTSRSAPAAVLGGLRFSSISAGGAHTCAITVAASVYCWGSNAAGQLGSYTTAASAVPVRVYGQP